MSKRIAIIEGDGIGKEVVPIGVAVLETLAQKRGWEIELVPFDLGADRFLRDGATFPEEDQKTIRETCDAVLLGALGDPRVPSLDYARDILFGLRFGLDLYCNVRPIQCLSDRLMPLKGKTAKDCDIIVFRENTEGIYVGMGGQFKRGTPDEVAINEDVNTRKGVERVIRAAFELAKDTGRKTVHMADKSNAMKHAHELWRRVFKEVAAEYPDIDAQHQYVDAMCFNLIRNPAQFEVIVTNNLFGDIVTDLGAALQGGLGMAASANVRPGQIGLFEPVHGSAPDIEGQGKANPIATVLTVGMMLTHLGFEGEEAKLVEIVRRAIEENKCTADVGGTLRTEEVGAWILAQIA
ncbi:MAG: isocitrate/isopropylmalate dehydrogenase family protein [Sandaracinaceae bacterium]